MAELSTLSKASIYNQVYPLQKPDYSRDVTEASNNAFVLVHLTSSLGNNIESRKLTELWRELARKFGDIKFCEMRADLCIEGYPEKNTPTILVYRNGDIKKQVVTLRSLRGPRTDIKGMVTLLNSTTLTMLTLLSDIQELLRAVGAVKEDDHRILKRNDEDSDPDSNRLRNGRSKESDDNDDWD